MPGAKPQLPRWKIWLLAARPRTLPAAAAPVLMGAAMAWTDGPFGWAAFVVTLAAAVLIQIGTNFHNDLYDFLKKADTEERLGPLRVTQAGLVSPEQMKRATVFVFGLAALLGLYLVYRGGWPILAIGVLAILFGVLYTAGPRPIGYTGWADLLVLLFFGPVATAGTYYVITGRWSPAAGVLGLSPGLLSTALLTVNNLRDAENDRRAGKRTLAVLLGKGFARAEYTAAVLAAIVLPVGFVLVVRSHFGLLATLAILVPAVRGVRQVHTLQGAALNRTLALTGRMLALFGLLFSAGWLL